MNHVGQTFTLISSVRAQIQLKTSLTSCSVRLYLINIYLNYRTRPRKYCMPFNTYKLETYIVFFFDHQKKEKKKKKHILSHKCLHFSYFSLLAFELAPELENIALAPDLLNIMLA